MSLAVNLLRERAGAHDAGSWLEIPDDDLNATLAAREEDGDPPYSELSGPVGTIQQ
jgi:hypothetical protein